MRHLFGCPDIVSLTEKFLMARNFFPEFSLKIIPHGGPEKIYNMPEAKGLNPFIGAVISFLEPSQLPGEYAAHAAKCVAQRA